MKPTKPVSPKQWKIIFFSLAVSFYVNLVLLLLVNYPSSEGMLLAKNKQQKKIPSLSLTEQDLRGFCELVQYSLHAQILFTYDMAHKIYLTHLYPD